jgi:hypothetical protein
MAEYELTQNQIKDIEQQINELTLGKVKNRHFCYTMLPWMPDYQVICQYVLDKYGVFATDVTFDDDGKVHLAPTKVHPYKICADNMLMEDNYPKPQINKGDENAPLTIDNIKSVEIVLADPCRYILS